MNKKYLAELGANALRRQLNEVDLGRIAAIGADTTSQTVSPGSQPSGPKSIPVPGRRPVAPGNPLRVFSQKVGRAMQDTRMGINALRNNLSNFRSQRKLRSQLRPGYTNYAKAKSSGKIVY